VTSRRRAVAAEFFGTAALLVAVVGSGIMAERLSNQNLGVALLANAIATGFALYVLISVFGPVSRAHFNPVVTLAAVINRDLSIAFAWPYALAQFSGAIVGVWLAHVMFDLSVLQSSTHVRTGWGQWVSEVVATAGLLVTIAGTSRHTGTHVAAAVGAYIAGAYWFTASTAFANPAVTIARTLTDTFAGIRPVDAFPFIASQLIGMTIGMVAVRLLFGRVVVEPRHRRARCC
jgi:glycerol uptake facilitator-like aquaporin